MATTYRPPTAYVGITDRDWFSQLHEAAKVDEVNFWQPSPHAFRALTPGDMTHLMRSRAEETVGLMVKPLSAVWRTRPAGARIEVIEYLGVIAPPKRLSFTRGRNRIDYLT